MLHKCFFSVLRRSSVLFVIKYYVRSPRAADRFSAGITITGRVLFAFIHSSRPALITAANTITTVVPPHCSPFLFVFHTRNRSFGRSGLRVKTRDQMLITMTTEMARSEWKTCVCGRRKSERRTPEVLRREPPS